ncbi:MAG: hypothetical protein PF517_04915 [Salinivirgaceae bacterium]|jgi:predicted  nucleic acid-binding Zn-ribbon protein|nr:hypothetical protein [Salinivirgaceae bacterium]
METPQLIGGFKEKFEKFVYLYKELKSENNQFKTDIHELKSKLSGKESQINELKHKLETNDLAKTFIASGENSKDAKTKINRIVREIDNCIALLNR